MTRTATATLADALRSEWTKLRSLQSTVYTLVAFMVIGVGLSLLISGAGGSEYESMSAAEREAFSPLGMALFGIHFAQLAIAVLGVLVVTSEYATGMIHPSLSAVPQRGRLLAAKAIVFTVVVLGAGLVTGFAMFFVAQGVLAGNDAPYLGPSTLQYEPVLRAVLGVGLYLAALGLLALAVGTLVRWTAGAITVLVAGVIFVPVLSQTLPASWEEALQTYWPTSAGMQLVLDDPTGLDPWAGYGVMVGFVALMLAAAYAALRHRDA